MYKEIIIHIKMGGYLTKDKPKEVERPNIIMTESLMRDVVEVRARRESQPIPVVALPAPVKVRLL